MILIYVTPKSTFVIDSTVIKDLDFSKNSLFFEDNVELVISEYLTIDEFNLFCANTNLKYTTFSKLTMYISEKMLCERAFRFISNIEKIQHLHLYVYADTLTDTDSFLFTNNEIGRAHV